MYEKYRDLLSKDVLLVAEGGLNIDDFSGMLRLTAEKLYSIDQARADFARCIMVNWDSTSEAVGGNTFVPDLKSILQPLIGGNCPVVVNYISRSASSSIQLGEAWRIHPSDELIQRLQNFLDAGSVEVQYR